MDTNAMFKLSYGLFILTAKENGRDNGCVINTAAQVTAEPNRVAICVNRAGFTHDMIERSGAFALSVISQKADFSLFTQFGFCSGRDTDKFSDYSAYARTENGLCYITEGTNAYICARVEQTIPLGTHTMFIGAVTEARVLTDCPSATYEYYFSHIKPKPQERAPEADGKKRWRCRICGYEYVGETLPPDYVCPVCAHPASDFERCISE